MYVTIFSAWLFAASIVLLFALLVILAVSLRSARRTVWRQNLALTFNEVDFEIVLEQRTRVAHGTNLLAEMYIEALGLLPTDYNTAMVSICAYNGDRDGILREAGRS